MSFPYPPVPAKLITFKNGNQKLAVACGPITQWRDGTALPPFTTYAGKVVTFKNGRPKYAIAEECCEYPLDLPMSFVEQTNWPPYGISQHIRVTGRSVFACPDYDCLTGILTHNGAGHWLGSIGGVTIDAYLAAAIPDPSWPPGSVATIMLFDVGGCISPPESGDGTQVINVHTDPALGPTIFLGMQTGYSNGSIFPFHARMPGFLQAGACCACNNAHLALEFTGFCKRVRMGKLVGFKNGKPKYAVGGCCPSCQQAQNCCDLYAGCDLHATVSVTHKYVFNGVLSENCTATQDVPMIQAPTATPPGACASWGWCNTGFGFIPACGSWRLYAKCDKLAETCHGGHSDNLPKCRYTIRLENTETGCNDPTETMNGFIQGTVDVCDCEPLSITVSGTNTSGFWDCTGVVGRACCQWTATVTLHR